MTFLRKHSLLILLTGIALFLHYFNLNWGAPYYFHPDERNIASSVSQLHFPDQMNPHFFAYGSLPIYAIYGTGMLMNILSQELLATVTFEQAIIISRAFSALFATLLIPLLFLLGKRLHSEKAGLLAAFFATASTGLIQFSHYGTFELWLTFFTTLLFWFCLKALQTKDTESIMPLGLLMGILIATKISHLALLPLPIAVLCMLHFSKRKSTRTRRFLLSLRSIMLFLVLTALVYTITNPFVFLDTSSFRNSMEYESSLALGKLPVFYTGEFFGTIPVLFQLLNIYPFLLNPLITALFIPSFFYVLFFMYKKHNAHFLLLTTCYLLLFLSQAFLFVKWTRYMVPTLPFIYLIVAVSMTIIIKQATNSLLRQMIIWGTSFVTIVFALSYFITAFVQQDTRIAAYEFAEKTIPSSASILSEVYDIGIVPFNASYPNITLFNFYDIENKTIPDGSRENLNTALTHSQYILLPSQRVLKVRLQNPKQFPNGATFYTKLMEENFGYEKIYETPCDLFCHITYLGSPVFRFEQTASVFDRPTVWIYKKVSQ